MPPPERRGRVNPCILTSVEILDERFEWLDFGNVHLEKLYSGCRWAEGPACFAAGEYLS
jgi:gluconolactonase